MVGAVETLSSLEGIADRVPPGETRHFRLLGSESFSGTPVRIPIAVKRGHEAGPRLFLTAALHGNEINGTGAIRDLITDPSMQLKAGLMLLVPVINVLGFDRHSRYLPDRRDLNRCFPGSRTGSLSSRMARTVFDEIVRRCDFGIDLHTAAVRRTNYPNVRGDLSNEGVARLAKSFGCQWIISAKGPRGSLCREATRNSIPTIILEAGEVWKVEPGVISVAHRGVKNVLADLGMLDAVPERPPLQVTIERTKWTRADRGGFLQFHTSPGHIVARGEPLATCTSLLGAERNVIISPFDGVVIGMTTLPAVSPGEPVCHLGRIDPATMESLTGTRKAKIDPVSQRLRDDLATNVNVVRHNPHPDEEPT